MTTKTKPIETRQGVYHLEGDFAYVIFTDGVCEQRCCYIHPDADMKELNYYCQDPGCRTVIELTVTKLYDGLGLIGARPLDNR